MRSASACGVLVSSFSAPGQAFLDAERGELTKCTDKPAGFTVVPAVVGMHGEVGGLLSLPSWLAGLATSAAEREQVGDPS